MSSIALVIIYALMLVFDAAVIGGTVWLIVERNWSAWWVLAAYLFAAGSNPKNMIVIWKGGAA